MNGVEQRTSVGKRSLVSILALLLRKALNSMAIVVESDLNLRHHTLLYHVKFQTNPKAINI